MLPNGCKFRGGRRHVELKREREGERELELSVHKYNDHVTLIPMLFGTHTTHIPSTHLSFQLLVTTWHTPSLPTVPN